ncbi:MAG: enoyl-CoA hydratase/isomerase family protein [Microbacteriaceae bacterium]
MSQVLTEIHDGAMTITLNRPEAINALSVDMIRQLAVAFDVAETDSAVRAVLLTAAGERGFCAGGDVRQVYFDVTAGQGEVAVDFFEVEYALNARIAEFSKPVVALMAGVCMGGGVGLAGHASIRIVTDSSRVAMPETKIGFTPDVGGSWLLGHAPGRLGERLALHGQTMGPGEAIIAGFADVYVPAAAWDDMVAAVQAVQAAIAADRELTAVLREFTAPAPLAAFGLPEFEIDRIYSGATVDDIIAALDEVAPDDANELRALSPTSLEVTLRSVRAARTMSLREALAQEFKLVSWFLTERGDTIEGIRALLVDKDKSPVWPPLAERLPI